MTGAGNIARMSLSRRKHRNIQNRAFFAAIWLGLLAGPLCVGQRPRISEDRELKELDLGAWDCRDRLEGTAKTPDGLERNRLKNRAVGSSAGPPPKEMDTAAFLRYVGALDAQTQGKRRKDLVPAQKTELENLEQQLVSLTGYLVLAYAGPPESTNCGSTDFHDWHLEVFAQPSDHPPQPGDPTPIICEITPRGQNAIFRDGVRLQSLAAFIRAPDLSHESTRHPARKIRITGYLLWDDDHNGSADVGPTILKVSANKYHNPWRSTAWEIHPVTKIEVLDDLDPAPPAVPSASSGAILAPTASPAPTPEFITLMRPVTIRIPYGETILPRGLRLQVVSRSGQGINVQYMGKTQTIPADAAIRADR
ncbi:MAG: hypothetical protein M3480_08965 [Verrucomicrobiota bacterium]|nr:hypothetical protein [Verrucomicrobiota bacterium]